MHPFAWESPTHPTGASDDGSFSGRSRHPSGNPATMTQTYQIRGHSQQNRAQNENTRNGAGTPLCRNFAAQIKGNL
jgi:hypothetical protein